MLITPTKGWGHVDIREIWRYRELLFILVWRDLRSRYRQMALGPLWALIQPFGTMVVFTVIFGGLADIPSEGIPYPIFSYAALLPWQFFARSAQMGGQSLLAMKDILAKVYFPRVLAPMTAALSALVDFGIAFAILLGMMIFYSVPPSWYVVTFPLFLVLAVFAGVGTALWIAAFNVEFRDLTQAVPFVLNLAMFATPVVYPMKVIPDAWRPFYSLNPMVGVIEGFRWSLLDRALEYPAAIPIAVGVTVAVVFFGLLLFGRAEKTYVDRA